MHTPSTTQSRVGSGDSSSQVQDVLHRLWLAASRVQPILHADSVGRVSVSSTKAFCFSSNMLLLKPRPFLKILHSVFHLRGC